MMELDGPLDFESEDPLHSSSLITKKRRKVIGLDDLLTDYYKEKSKLIERKYKKPKPPKNYNSDEDENGKEALFSECVDKCQEQMKEISGEEEISYWGLRVFGDQKPRPLDFPELGSCTLLQSFMNNDLNSMVQLSSETGETFIEGLLINGWLSKLVSASSHVEKSIATWTFNLLLYSSKEELRTSVCNFWCAILSSQCEADAVPLKVEWFPSYSELKKALEIYGFLFNLSSNTEPVTTDSVCGGPPQNIRAWMEVIAACCEVRSKQPIFSTSEAEELVEVIICLFLDRQLQGLSVLLYKCLLSAISYFTDNEWHTSCEKVAMSLARRVPRDLNCLRTVECISGVTARSKHLKCAIAYQILVNCFDNKTTDEEGILQLLISINVKDKSCDLFKMFIYLVLTENWLSTNPLLDDKPVIYEMWCVLLRNCSCQISSTDLRSYASKVRYRASYVLQGTVKRAFVVISDNMKGERMAKRSSFGSIVRKRLSDITNSQPQPKLQIQDEKPTEASASTENYINQLLKENMNLMKLIAERNKIIELSGAELQKLRINYQKMQLQNWNLAQSNSQFLAELNVGREKLKALQHERVCKDALLKAKNSELEVKPQMNCQMTSSQGGEKEVGESLDKDNDENKPHNHNRRRAIRSQSMAPSTRFQQDTHKEKVENKRRCLRRQSAGFKSYEREPTENLFEIDDTKFPVTSKLLDSPMHIDGSAPLGLSMKKEAKEENSAPRIEAQGLQRPSIGRLSRRAVEKVQSYKEAPLKTKMRRPE